MLASGRDKIETEAQFAKAVATAKEARLDGLRARVRVRVSPNPHPKALTLTVALTPTLSRSGSTGWW